MLVSGRSDPTGGFLPSPLRLSSIPTEILSNHLYFSLWSKDKAIIKKTGNSLFWKHQKSIAAWTNGLYLLRCQNSGINSHLTVLNILKVPLLPKVGVYIGKEFFRGLRTA